MPQLNWDVFAQLPGSAQQNFEDLCRAVTKLQYGRFGDFRRLANQPGVEFHLRLREECGIGHAGEWHGWQCRWYDLPSGRALGTTRQNQIEETIRTTERSLPELTHWTLWTRHMLSKADQSWFYALGTKLKLALATTADLEPLMSGPAALLRASYFGELVLTRADLATRHQESVAPILPRWLSPVHQQVEVERRIRRMLGESGSWGELLEVADRLAAIDAALANESGMSERLRTLIADFRGVLNRTADTLRQAHAAVTLGDFDLLREVLKRAPLYPAWSVRSVPDALRAVQRVIALRVTNCVQDLILAHALCRDIDELVGVRMIAVCADAGSGKTQLAAELTKERSDRSAGVLLHGRQLHARQDLNDLARKFTIHGQALATFESLVAALDAAGQRERRRLPLVIDGLNEAENPGDWKDPLASLHATLERYPNVLVVVTLRTGGRKSKEWIGLPFEPEPKVPVTPRMLFSDLAVPSDVRQLEMEGFGALTRAAVRSYFTYFRIQAEPDLSYELLGHPLTLRMFCEVTNPKRDHDVGYEAMPRSLTALFARYRDEVANRIAQLSDASHSYSAEDVRQAFFKLSEGLWLQGARGLDETRLRTELNDQNRSWKTSLIHKLEQEGVIVRNEGDQPGDRVVVPVYDAFGGYLVGDYLVRSLKSGGFAAWIAQPANLALLNEAGPDAHPFAGDIFRALAGLIPTAFGGQQLWSFLSGRMKDEALRLAILEGTKLDAKTLGAIGGLIHSPSASTRIFDDLTETSSAVGHPLNAIFLDQELRKMNVADRDLRWTEWIRRQHDMSLYGESQNHYENLGEHWKNDSSRYPSDRLRARWVMWALTSTSRSIRYCATRALYWYGRHAPDGLFDLCLDSLAINDPYVPERMLAAGYGVAMFLYAQPEREARKAVFVKFARGIFERMFVPPAPPNGTTHSVAREYARRIIQLAVVWEPQAFTTEEKASARPPFSVGGLREWREVAAAKAEDYGAASPLGFDFRNYTLGRLVDGRAPHDFDHRGYQLVCNQLLWRVEQLGWTAERFHRIDEHISSDHYRPREDPFKTDRYGEKYSMIAFHELDGFRHDARILKTRRPAERPAGMDIDPSFPEPCAEEKLVTEDLLGAGIVAGSEWLRHGRVDLTPYFQPSAVAGECGPWVMLDGALNQEDLARGRRLICRVRTLLVARTDVTPFIAAMRQSENPGLEPADRARAMITFAGEIPWCDTFPPNGRTELRVEVERKKVPHQRTEHEFYRHGVRVPTAELVELLSRMREFPKGNYPAELEAEIAQIEAREIPVVEERLESRYATFRALLPVCEFASEEPSMEGEVNRPTLAKELATALKLSWMPGTLDFASRHGERTTTAIAHRMQALYNRQQFFFIRATALAQYLKTRKQTLVVVVSGERQLVAHEAARTSGYEERICGFQVVHKL